MTFGRSFWLSYNLLCTSLIVFTSGGYYVGELHRVLSEFAAGRASSLHKSKIVYELIVSMVT